MSPLKLTPVAPADIPQVADFSALFAPDLPGGWAAFVHGGSVPAASPVKYERGVNIFGNTDIPKLSGEGHGAYDTCLAASVAISDVIFFPHSRLVLTRDGRVLQNNIKYLPGWGQISNLDRHFVREGDEYFFKGDFDSLANGSKRLETAICAATVAANNYGHFLFDGLPLGMLQAQHPATAHLPLLHPNLKSWQDEILTLLGLRPRVLTLESPIYARRLLINTQVSGHVYAPSRFVRPLFDAIKFAAGHDEGAATRIYLRRDPQHKRGIHNHAEMEAALQERGFQVLMPEQYKVRDQARLLSKARIVVGQSGAALANVCFAPTGCNVFDIMPDRYPDQWMRRTSIQMGHRWHVFATHVPEEDIQKDSDPKWAGSFDFRLRVPLTEFTQALDAVLATVS